MDIKDHIKHQLGRADTIELIGASKNRHFAKFIGIHVIAAALLSPAAHAGMASDYAQVNAQVRATVDETRTMATGSIYLFNRASDIGNDDGPGYLITATSGLDKTHNNAFSTPVIRSNPRGDVVVNCIVSAPHPVEGNLSAGMEKYYGAILDGGAEEIDAFADVAFHEAAHCISYQANRHALAVEKNRARTVGEYKFQESANETIADVFSILKVQQRHFKKNLVDIRDGDLSPVSSVAYNKVLIRQANESESQEEKINNYSIMSHATSLELVYAINESIKNPDKLINATDSELIMSAFALARNHVAEIAARTNSHQEIAADKDGFAISFLHTLNNNVRTPFAFEHRSIEQLTKDRAFFIANDNPQDFEGDQQSLLGGAAL